jgi:hypothetical protein
MINNDHPIGFLLCALFENTTIKGSRKNLIKCIPLDHQGMYRSFKCDICSTPPSFSHTQGQFNIVLSLRFLRFDSLEHQMNTLGTELTLTDITTYRH